MEYIVIFISLTPPYQSFFFCLFFLEQRPLKLVDAKMDTDTIWL